MNRPSITPRTRVAAVTAVIIMLLTTIASGLSPAAADEREGTITASSVGTCAHKAMAQAEKNKKYKYWVCLGKKAKYYKKGGNPAAAFSASDANGDVLESDFSGNGATPSEALSSRGLSDNNATIPNQAPGDDYEYWCENAPQCARVKTETLAEIKGNGFYGYGDEKWGSFDVIWRQSFNGAQNRYRLTLIHKSGYAVDSDFWVAQVYWNIPGPFNPLVGQANFEPAAISEYAKTATSPSKTGYTGVLPTVHSGDHFDALYGQFNAHGQFFGTPKMGLPHFHCPDLLCEYYAL